MKLGPFEIKLFKKEESQKTPTTAGAFGQEIGVTGTTVYSGIIYDEYNVDLQHTKKYEEYEQMRSGDGMVSAVLLGCSLPLRTAEWDIVPTSQDGIDREIADFVKDNLFEGLSISWDSFLEHIFLMNAFGFSNFEKIFIVGDDNKYYWKTLAPRLPKTSWSWEFDDSGGIKSWTQKVMKGEQSGTYTIPINKLLIFTNQREGSNYEGKSYLRAMRQHWYYKSHLYRIGAMAVERHGMGIPVITLPIGYTNDDVTTAKSIGESVRAHERAYVMKPPGWEFKIEGYTGQLTDPSRLIKHHNEMIATSILQQFLLYGISELGARALGETMSDFFLMALQAQARNIEDTMNAYGIKQLVDFNWKVNKYPKLKCSRLQAMDFVKLSQTLLNLAKSGFLQPDISTESALRTQMDLPIRSEDGEVEPVDKNENYQNMKERIYKIAGIKPKFQIGGYYHGEKAEEERKEKKDKVEYLREPTDLESNILALKEMEDGLDEAVNLLIQKVQSIQKDQIDNIAYEVSKREVDDIPNVKARYVSQMAENIKDVLVSIYNFGRKQVNNEIEKQARPVRLLKDEDKKSNIDEKAIFAYIYAKSLLVARRLSQKYLDTATFSAMNYKRSGIDNETTRKLVFQDLQELSDRELEKSANMAVMEAFGIGRNTEAQQYEEVVETAVYSAVMDTKSCIPCRNLDGIRHKLNDPVYATPNPRCSGGLRCRCINVYLMKEVR